MRLWWNREKRTAQASPAAAKKAVKVEYFRNKEARYIIYQRNDGIFEVWGRKESRRKQRARSGSITAT